MGAAVGHHGLLLAAAAGGGGYNAETVTWYNGISTAGGSTTTTEKGWADALIVAVIAASYGSKIKYLLPFIGTSIAAHRMPLRDSLSKGIAANTGATAFVDADCTNAGGLNNTAGASKLLNTFVKPEDLGTGSAGGMGIYLKSWTNAYEEPCGVYDVSNSARWVMDLRSGSENFRWSDVSTAVPSTASAGGAKHYYGQATSATNRKLCINGGTPVANTTNKPLITCGQEIRVGGSLEASTLGYASGAYSCFYATDGTMSDADMAAFHTLLDTYLITPTGR